MKDSRKDVKEYIESEIQKSGFPLEIKSSMILAKFGWNVSPHVMFFNQKKQRDSEIDIVAIKTLMPAIPKILVNVLVVECKKQEKKPWVFFEQDQKNTLVTTICAKPKEAYVYLQEHFKDHYYYNQKPCQFHFPSFVKSGEPDVIAKAINQVLDGLVFSSEQQVYLEEINWFYYPVIILDGRLFSAHVEPTGKIEITESKYLQLKVMRGLEEPEEIKVDGIRTIVSATKSYIIDIVKIDYLEGFLKMHACHALL